MHIQDAGRQHSSIEFRWARIEERRRPAGAGGPLPPWSPKGLLPGAPGWLYTAAPPIATRCFAVEDGLSLVGGMGRHAAKLCGSLRNMTLTLMGIMPTASRRECDRDWLRVLHANAKNSCRCWTPGQKRLENLPSCTRGSLVPCKPQFQCMEPAGLCWFRSSTNFDR